ncbi:MAG: hypothetical protein SGI92_05690 [Bryobacteraceae bacterium]|nr:hypothetical protein [Bryobacteraceae bacterium]
MSRKFAAILIALITVALGVGVVFLLSGNKGPKTAAQYLQYFPEREAVVFYLDVDALRTSGILDKLVGSTVGESADYRSFVQQTGFDYKKDLDAVMLNSAGAIHYFVLKGRFDWPKLRAYAEKEGGKCQGANYCSVKGSTPDRVVSWRRISDHYLGLASARDESGARAIDRRKTDALPMFVPPVAPLFLHLPGDAIRASDQLPPGTRLFAKALEKAERVVFALAAEGSDKFALTADVTCTSQEDAAVLRAQLEGLTKTLASFIARESKVPSPTDLSGILTSGSFLREERKVKAKWGVPKAFLDSLGGS